jgi:hypothetical protein
MNARQIKAVKLMVMSVGDADMVTYDKTCDTFEARRYYAQADGYTAEKFAARFNKIGDPVGIGDETTSDGKGYWWVVFEVRDAVVIARRIAGLVLELTSTSF